MFSLVAYTWYTSWWMIDGIRYFGYAKDLYIMGLTHLNKFTFISGFSFVNFMPDNTFWKIYKNVAT